jgi:hypothetical protein
MVALPSCTQVTNIEKIRITTVRLRIVSRMGELNIAANFTKVTITGE